MEMAKDQTFCLLILRHYLAKCWQTFLFASKQVSSNNENQTRAAAHNVQSAYH